MPDSLVLIRESMLCLGAGGLYLSEPQFTTERSLAHRAMEGDQHAFREWAQRVYTHPEMRAALVKSADNLDVQVGQVGFGGALSRAAGMVMSHARSADHQGRFGIGRNLVWVPDSLLMSLSADLRVNYHGQPPSFNSDGEVVEALREKIIGIPGFWMLFLGAMSDGRGKRGWMALRYGMGWVRATGFPYDSHLGERLLVALRSAMDGDLFTPTSFAEKAPPLESLIGKLAPLSARLIPNAQMMHLALHHRQRLVPSVPGSSGMAMLALVAPGADLAQAFYRLVVQGLRYRCLMQEPRRFGSERFPVIGIPAILPGIAPIYILRDADGWWLSGSGLSSLLTDMEMIPYATYFVDGPVMAAGHFHHVVRCGYGPLVEQVFPERARFPSIPPDEHIPKTYLRAFSWLKMPESMVLCHRHVAGIPEGDWSSIRTSDYPMNDYITTPSTCEIDHEWSESHIWEGD